MMWPKAWYWLAAPILWEVWGYYLGGGPDQRPRNYLMMCRAAWAGLGRGLVTALVSTATLHYPLYT